LDLAASDLDGDDRPDVVGTRWAPDLSFFSGLGDGTLGAAALVGVQLAGEGIIPFDLDADGHGDLVVANTSDKKVTFIRSSPARSAFELPMGLDQPIPGGQEACGGRLLGPLSLESLQVVVQLDHPRPADLRLELEAPGPIGEAGAESMRVLLKPEGCAGGTIYPDYAEPCRAADLSPLYVNMARGEWRLCVRDTAPPGDAAGEPAGRLRRWSLVGRSSLGMVPALPSSRAPVPGLVARIYGSPERTGLRGLQVRYRVFDAPPAPLDGPYSVVWTGYFFADRPGLYTFSAEAQDGVRLLVDGAAAIDALAAQGEQTLVGEALALSTGWKPLELQYVHRDTGAGKLRLWVEALHLPRQAVPTERLGH